MAAVRQQVLNWLYSVLTSEYKDVNRTYNDVARALSYYSSLSPRTDVYTHENGASALLLHISGTLPVDFRGTTYRFPIALWVPHGYPQEAPLVYVTPTEGMMKSNIQDFLAILRDIFAKEPPVISRQQQNAPPRPQQVPPPIPPLPPSIARPTSRTSTVTSPEPPRPPPPPPKPGASSQSYSLAGPSRTDSGPPLPPLPTQHAYDNNRYSMQPQQSPREHQHAPQRSSSLRYETAPPLPPQPQRQPRRESSNSPVSPITPPEDPYRRQPYQPTYQQPRYTSNPPPQAWPPQQQPPPQQIPPSYMQQQPYPGPQGQWQQYPPQTQTQPRAKPPPPDLIDAPLTLSIPSEASTNLPAPPVPPNPEKDMLLHNIGRALCSQRQHTRSQTSQSLPGLESQHKAMIEALHKMEAEMQALESLNNLLNTNATILHTALHDADAMIDSSQHRTAPSVDELLVAPTVVGNQLYELVSEERSLGDALFVLGRAVERGRISPSVFAKMTRTLAREWYLKKALAKKIGRGMGLTTY
ncbi:hypothetical protein B0J14DRAFT_672873 [Halenospora varia]|nr:hypothetical protein B0J14DRAFT_672873 [Halenospora varia]